MARRRLNPDQRRRELLTTAERLLRLRGTAVRVEDVVAAAGAAKGTFYAYFDTWLDLLDTIRAEQVTAFRGTLAPLLGDPPLGGWERVLPDLATALIDFIIGLEGLHEVLFHSDFPRLRPLPPTEKPPAVIAGIIRRGQAAHAYAAVDPDATAILLFAIIHETADAIVAGADRARALAALHEMLHRSLIAPADLSALRKPRS